MKMLDACLLCFLIGVISMGVIAYYMCECVDYVSTASEWSD